MSKFDRIPLILSGSFTFLVVGLLVCLHIFGRQVVPKLRYQVGEEPRLLVCEGQIPWLGGETANRARLFWEAYGYAIQELIRVPCASLATCRSGSRSLPCARGDILVSLRDGSFSEDHVGETVSSFDPATGRVEWATILLPGRLDVPVGLSRSDVEALVLAHEIGHWIGYDHVRTRLAGPFFSEPSGHLMARGVSKLGWRDAGL